jgi:hypothetical protein
MNLFRRNSHLRDEDLLLLQEGELSRREIARAEQHLERCEDCRVRQASLLSSAEDLDDLNIASSYPPITDGARLQLQSRLAAAADGQGKLSWLASLRQPRVLLRLASVVALLALSIAWRQAYRPLQDRMAAYEETGPKPDHALTPGATRRVELSEICTLADDDLDPKLPADKERAVFQAYGMDERAARAYQVDYLINPQLGGDDELENLWPEPYHATVWNATAKDALETRLHGMVCSGQIGLQAAQQELATDWIAAYKKHFHANRPISTVAVADSPQPFIY